MATKESSHTVVIVGGGLTGLVLALMLEKLSVDYVLLEAYNTVTSNVGASIGLHPYGLRILDQLGCYEGLYARARPVVKATCRDGITGERLSTQYPKDIWEKRHGYPNLFTSRHILVSYLYEQIQNKDCLLIKKRVSRIDTHSDHAVVNCEDGSVFKGQIVVGADGVHSKVRSEIWRMAEDAGNKDWIPACDRAPVPVEYGCVFGTAATRPRSLGPGETMTATGPKMMTGLMSGPGTKSFFFHFWEMPKDQALCTVDKIPKFGQKDKEEQLASGAHLIVSDDGMRMGDVFSEIGEDCGITALPHFVMRRWHYGRVIIIGDAAHKYNPLTGHGGNSCIESCAALVSQLHSRGLIEPGFTSWPLNEVTTSFAALEEERVPRLIGMVEQAKKAMRTYAWYSWPDKLMHRHAARIFSQELLSRPESSAVAGASCLKFLPPPVRPHEWQYADEVTVKDKSTTTAGWVMATALPAALIAIFAMRAIREGRGGEFLAKYSMKALTESA